MYLRKHCLFSELGYRYLKYVDSIGAILIALYIIVNWSITAYGDLIHVKNENMLKSFQFNYCSSIQGMSLRPDVRCDFKVRETVANPD